MKASVPSRFAAPLDETIDEIDLRRMDLQPRRLADHIPDDRLDLGALAALDILQHRDLDIRHPGFLHPPPLLLQERNGLLHRSLADGLHLEAWKIVQRDALGLGELRAFSGQLDVEGCERSILQHSVKFEACKDGEAG